MLAGTGPSTSTPRPATDPAAAVVRHFVAGTLPLFAARGWDSMHGGLVERLAADGAPLPTRFRRSMLHGRQLYVFSYWAGVLGDSVYAAQADRIFEYAIARFWDRDHGGWYETVTAEGQPLDRGKVLYSHAFLIFGLASYLSCLGRSAAAPYLDATLDYVLGRFRRGAGLYHERLARHGVPASDKLDQNPLMHLVEALLQADACLGRAALAAEAGAIIATVVRAFRDDGMIVEHRTADLRPHPELGRFVEPGHQAEWAWLIDWHGRRTGSALPAGGPTGDLAGGLADAGFRTGWDTRHGGLFDRLDRRDLTVLCDTKRLWPVLELIKAAAALPVVAARWPGGPDAVTGHLLHRHLRPEGRWIERLNADLTVADPTMPASSCYHMSMAAVELARRAGIDPVACA